jgi:hypothetical protein
MMTEGAVTSPARVGEPVITGVARVFGDAGRGFGSAERTATLGERVTWGWLGCHCRRWFALLDKPAVTDGPDVALDVWGAQSQEAFLGILKSVTITRSITQASHITESSILLLLRNPDDQRSRAFAVFKTRGVAGALLWKPPMGNPTNRGLPLRGAPPTHNRRPDVSRLIAVAHGVSQPFQELLETKTLLSNRHQSVRFVRQTSHDQSTRTSSSRPPRNSWSESTLAMSGRVCRDNSPRLAHHPDRDLRSSPASSRDRGR